MMLRFTSCLAVLAVLVGVGQVWAESTPGTGIILFDEPTDTISVSGQTIIGTAATYEAQVMFTGAYSGEGFLFLESRRALEDKHLYVGTTYIRGFNYNVNFPAGMEANTILTLDEWHHVAYVYDGSQERLYLDGIRVAFLPAPTIDVFDSGGAAAVGARLNDASIVRPGFVGYLDSLRISNTARYDGVIFVPPQGDLTSDANALLLYNFNETPGSTLVVDESPLGRTGSLGVGFPEATLPTLIPEPSSIILLGTGAFGLLACWWRKRRG